MKSAVYAMVAFSAMFYVSVAESAPYKCSFASGADVVKQCDMDSQNIDQRCDNEYASSLVATCFVSNSGEVDNLRCLFHSSPLEAADFSADFETQSQLPGFLAGGATFVKPSTNNGALTVGYREKTSAPTLVALCTLVVQ